MKLIPKFKIGAKIRKAQKGLDVDELGIPGSNFIYKKSAPNIPGPDEKVLNFIDQSLIDKTNTENTILENKFNRPLISPTKKVKTDAYWLAQANRFTGNAFKTRQDIINWQLKNGLVGDGKFGRLSMNKWLELLKKPEDELLTGKDGETLYDYVENEQLKPKPTTYIRRPGKFLINGNENLSGVWTNPNMIPKIKNSNYTMLPVGTVYTGDDGKTYKVVGNTLRNAPKRSSDRIIVYKFAK